LQYSSTVTTVESLCDIFGRASSIGEDFLRSSITNTGVSVTTANELIACLKEAGIVIK
jgi:hypothetical protein